jgi:hypothetical protein
MIQLGILGYNYRLLWGCNGDNYTIISLYDFNYIITQAYIIIYNKIIK